MQPAFAEASAGKSGSSSIGRAIAFQAIGREFDPRLPLTSVFRVWGLVFGVWSLAPNIKYQTPNFKLS